MTNSILIERGQGVLTLILNYKENALTDWMADLSTRIIDYTYLFFSHSFQ